MPLAGGSRNPLESSNLLSQPVRRMPDPVAHAHLQRAERMLDRLAACTHRLRIFIEPSLRCFENVLVLPSWNAPLLARRTFRLQRAIRAGVRPIAPHHLTVLLGRHVIGQLLASRTAINILGGVVDEVLLAETTIRLR